ncbi:MAG: ribonuclease HII [Alphaproteobacteria bacterium]
MSSSLRFEIENFYGNLVAGVDEAGRGPWAGNVVAGAVVFLTQDIDENILNMLDDSKKMSAKKRELAFNELYKLQEQNKIAIGVGEASPEEIDAHNILQATFMAMSRAVKNMTVKPQFAIIDGNQKPKGLECDCTPVVKGDSKSYSISAASIVAKVTRDKQMSEYALEYPQYGFEKHAGYGVKQHIEALKEYGITPIHRKSYKPIKAYLK